MNCFDDVHPSREHLRVPLSRSDRNLRQNTSPSLLGNRVLERRHSARRPEQQCYAVQSLLECYGRRRFDKNESLFVAEKNQRCLSFGDRSYQANYS